MSNRICGKCGSHKVVDAGSYAGSSFFKCETCGQLGMREKFPRMTVFHQITASPEELAEKVVYREHDECDGWWVSNIVDGKFDTHEEAIVATLERLNSLINDVKEKVE